MTLARRTLGEIEIQRTRRHDPETSKIAATQAHGLANEHVLLILQAMRDGGDRDWIAHEIAAACALTSTQVSRRLGAMVADGDIVECMVGGKLVAREAPTGRPARCYRLAGPKQRSLFDAEAR